MIRTSLAVRLIAAGGLTAGRLAVGASPAGAQPVDYCTAVPDSGASFDFNEACRRHDECYGNQPYGGGEAGRGACDVAFYNAMVVSCGTMWQGMGEPFHTCLAGAGIYYWGVDTFGGWFWDDLPVGTVTVGEPEPVPPEGTVTVGPIGPVEPARGGGGGEGGGGGSAGGGGGGGWGDIPVVVVGSGGGGGSSGGTVTVGPIEVVDYDSE